MALGVRPAGGDAMNTRKRKLAGPKTGKPLRGRKQLGKITRVNRKHSPGQIDPITHYDRVTYVSALSDFSVPFCRAFAVAAAAGADFGSIAITRPYRVMIASVFDSRSVADDLAAITTARGWLPEKPVAVVNLILHWGQLQNDGEVARIAKATAPELIIVEAGANGLSEVRSRIGDSDAALVLPVDRPDNDLDSFRLRIERHGEKYHLVGGDGLILKMDRDDASFIPLGRVNVIDRARLAAAKKTTIQKGDDDAK